MQNLVHLLFMHMLFIEALIIPIKNSKQYPNYSYTINTHKHKACSIGYKVVCSKNDEFSKPFKMFRGKEAISKFCMHC